MFKHVIQDEDVCRCALFHSAYSNSYVNLAVFQEGTERSKVAEVRGCDVAKTQMMECHLVLF